MARRSDRLEAHLEALAAAHPDTPEGQATIAEALRSASCHRVARAARIVSDEGLSALVPELLEAFPRFFSEPVRRDPGCGAKAAIVEALLQCGHPHPEPFLRGVAHRQLEPSWGPPVDTATHLRGRAAMGLVAIGWPDAPVVLAGLLHDPQVPCRIAGVRGLIAHGDPVLGRALIHLRLGLGEPEGEVISECMDALIALDADAAVPWLVQQLQGEDPTMAECAVLSLGASRRPEALQPLCDFVASCPLAEERRIGLVAIGLLRSEGSIDWLLGWLERSDPADAASALEGLAVHAHDPAVAARVRGAAEAGGHADLLTGAWA